MSYIEKANAPMGIGTKIKTDEPHEPEYELVGIKYGRFTKNVVLIFVKTSYEYVPAKLKKGTYDGAEMRVVIKKVKKKVKACGAALDVILNDPDPVICAFAEFIVKSIGNEKLYPKWYRTLLIERERDGALSRFSDEENAVNAKYDELACPYREEARSVSADILHLLSEIEGAEAQLESAQRRLCVFDTDKKSFPECLAWWKYSDKKRAVILDEISVCEERSVQKQEEKSCLEKRLFECASKMSEVERERMIELCSITSRKEELEKSIAEKLASI